MATVIRLRSRLERPERSQMSPKSHLSVASRSLGKSAAQFGAGRGAGWSGIVLSSSYLQVSRRAIVRGIIEGAVQVSTARARKSQARTRDLRWVALNGFVI